MTYLKVKYKRAQIFQAEAIKVFMPNLLKKSWMVSNNDGAHRGNQEDKTN